MSDRRWRAVALTLALMLVAGALSACGSDSGTADTGGESKSSPESTSNPESESNPSIAFLSQGASNSYLSATWEGIQEVAEKQGGDLTLFDAEFDPTKQQEQLQAVIASNKYDGVIISAVSSAVGTDVTAAAEAGLDVVAVGAILGDRLDTPKPQVEGVKLAVAAPPTYLGGELGELTLRACEDKDPCRVVYFYGLKGTPTDSGLFSGFSKKIAENDAVEIVAEGEGEYLGPDVALAAMQNIMQSTSDIDVVVGADQSMQGVQLALEQAGELDGVSIIGLGGSRVGVKRIGEGVWYGGAMMVPKTEGEIALEGMLELTENGALSGSDGINPLEEIPADDRLITPENAGEFPAQWNG